MSSEGDAGNVGAHRPFEDSRAAEMFGGEPQRVSVEQLPEPLKNRLRALKQLQATTAVLEAKFFQDVHAMECRYHKEYTKLNMKRDEIVRGTYEPSEEDLFPGDPFPAIQGELAEKLSKELKLEGPGIPDFWPTIFKNVAMLSDTVYPHDEPILKHLQDVRCSLNEQPMGFKLEFHFSPNEYFSNTVLTKEYFMKCAPDSDDPFSFEGPEIFRSKGCTIDWFNGKNITVKTVKKRQRNKLRGQTRTVTKQVQAESFFNFFSPPEIPEDNSEMDEETQSVLSADFELGHYIRERIVPHAVLYYTGELLDEDYEDDTTSESSEGDLSPGSEESENSGSKSQETEEGEPEEGTEEE
uniref:Nucleosome assembly protein 1-like 4 n=1 Tax=Lygus hesperus TaxID=30085 RepID=A0A0A9W8I8_LYGHE